MGSLVQRIFEKCNQLLPAQRIAIACRIGMRPRSWPTGTQTPIEQTGVLMAWADQVDRLDLLEGHINAEMGSGPPPGGSDE
jgi:hypothetical protein